MNFHPRSSPRAFPPRRLRTVIPGAAFVLSLLFFCITRAETLSTSFVFDATQEGNAENSTQQLTALNFKQESGGGTLQQVSINLTLDVDYSQSVSGSCSGEGDCADAVFVRQSINARPKLVIAPGTLDLEIPIRLPGQSGVEAQFDLMRECGNRTSCSRSDSEVLRTTASINFTDPAILSSFRGAGTLPIQVVTDVTHWSFCNWREHDDSFFIFRDFLEYHFSCPSMRSTYRATWSFAITVNYSSFVTGFHDPEPKAVAGGPYVGLTGDSVIFDGGGSLKGTSASSYSISKYEWDFENDGVFDVSSASPIAQHVYPAPFAGSAALRVTRKPDQTTHTATARVDIKPKSDLDADGDTDLDDMDILLQDLGKAVVDSVCGGRCDLDGDGNITALDARVLVTQCTRANCSSQ